MISYRPTRIFIEASVQDSPITRTVLERAEAPVEIIESPDDLVGMARAVRPSIAEGKRWLALIRHKGAFFKACPAGQTRQGVENACCNYYILNYASNCHMECSYCYLQAYLNLPYMAVYANLGDMLMELEHTLASRPEAVLRIGTGELADSLALDPITRYSVPLVEFFASRPNAVLEFKTKSDCVENLLGLDHRGRTVVSWSMNPRFIQRSEEHKTADIDRRLAAAGRCAAAGYPVAFHLDPIIHYPDWETDYLSLVDELFERIPAGSIAWLSLGAMRMTPRLQSIMRERFPGSRLPLGELVPTEDGRLRYFRPIRVEMYQKIVSRIRRHSATPVYTCMENHTTWRRVFGSDHPGDRAVGDQLVTLVR